MPDFHKKKLQGILKSKKYIVWRERKSIRTRPIKWQGCYKTKNFLKLGLIRVLIEKVENMQKKII